MLRSLQTWLQLLFPTGKSHVVVSGAGLDARRRLREFALIWIRWIVAGFLLVLAMAAETRFQGFVVLLALLLVTSNVAIGWMIGLNSPVSLQRVRSWITIAEWLVALGVLLAMGHEAAVMSTVTALVLLLPTIVRYRIAGVCLAMASSTVMMAIWAGIHVSLVNAIPTDRTQVIAVQWLVVQPLAIVIFGVLIHFARSQRRWEQSWHRAELAAQQEHYEQALGQWKRMATQQEIRLLGYQRQECGLTEREWEILQLLPDSDLKYKGIGHRLCISEETVKSHVRHIGRKLGVSSRWQIVTAARGRGLLGDDTLASANRDEQSSEGLQILPPPRSSN